MNARVLLQPLRGYARILAVSDIHGSLDFLEQLLKKAAFGPADALVFVGDLIEKGPQSLGVLRLVMQLCAQGRAWAVCGNCDADVTELLRPEKLPELQRYMARRRSGWNCGSLVWDMAEEAGLTELVQTDPEEFRARICSLFRRELDFLRGLPDVLESEDCIFVHAGLDADDPARAQRSACLRQKAFHTVQGPRYAKTVVVGHQPVVLYGRDGCARANPLYNAARNVFSIDGGCRLKYDGQLNCLIRSNADGCWSFAAWDGLPQVIAKQVQQAGKEPFCFYWGDHFAELLARSGEMSRVRHLRTGREMEIPSRLLYTDAAGRLCVDNYSDYRLPVLPGDRLSVAGEVPGWGLLVKKNGVSGWYAGAVQRPEA